MVYKTLTKLEESGMVTKVKVERAGLMPERRIYRLTSKGKKRLANLVEKSLTNDNLTSDLSDLGYLFIHGLPKKEAMECLNKRKAFVEKIIRDLQERQAALVEKEPINRTVSIEKSLDRFKSEQSHLKKLAKTFG
jgi:DNA-binding PadR family transcriptional regulator